MSLLQQQVRDMEGQGSEHGFILDEHLFALFALFAEIKDWVRDKAIPSSETYWELSA